MHTVHFTLQLYDNKYMLILIYLLQITLNRIFFFKFQLPKESEINRYQITEM